MSVLARENQTPPRSHHCSLAVLATTAVQSWLEVHELTGNVGGAGIGP